MSTLNDDEIQGIIHADLKDPFILLGKHSFGDGRWEVRAFIPGAVSVSVLPEKKGRARNDAVSVTASTGDVELDLIHADGLFEGVLADDPGNYELKARFSDGAETTGRDPYSFLPVFSEEDRYLFNEGNLHKAYERLGAHVLEIDGARGVFFSVWAPSAKRVSVVGDFNGWDGRRHQMRLLGASGVWEIFVPGLDYGAVYKYEIKKYDPPDHLVLKSDPYGFYHEGPPDNAAVVWNIDAFDWSDDDWMRRRTEQGVKIDQPINIYEAHLASWRRKPEHGDRRLNYRELAHELGDYLKFMGYTHIELLPVAEHPLEASWGYQVTGYYSVHHRLGVPEDFQYFVDYLHRLGIGVILDWVPAHFPKDANGLAYFDGTHLYEHANPREGEHKDWGTLIFNFGRHEVRNFLVANALFWMDKYHIDGLRVDAVASMLYRDYSRKDGEWIPNEYGGRENLEAIRFLQQVNAEVHRQFPGVLMIAEESTDWPGVTQPTYAGGLGFTFKWNMGWMHDTLAFFCLNPVFRKFHMNKITFAMWYAYHENWILSLSHDEVVHGKRSILNKMPGDRWRQFANVRLLLGFMLGHPGKKLNFMGYEFGQWKEWTYDTSLDWHETNNPLNAGLLHYTRELNLIYRNYNALWDQDTSNSGFAWVDATDADNTVISFLRFGYDWHNILLFACNFTPVPRHDYRIGVPHGGYWEEILNSDAVEYGGGGIGNFGGVHSEPVPWQGRPCSVRLQLPPLGVCVFQWRRDP